MHAFFNIIYCFILILMLLNNQDYLLLKLDNSKIYSPQIFQIIYTPGKMSIYIHFCYFHWLVFKKAETLKFKYHWCLEMEGNNLVSLINTIIMSICLCLNEKRSYCTLNLKELKIYTNHDCRMESFWYGSFSFIKH